MADPDALELVQERVMRNYGAFGVRVQADVARERLLRGVEGTFSYNLFSVSRVDLERIQELHRAYFRELRRIVADSEPSECIALATVHLVELGPTAKRTG
jgi:hypothetical protein